MPVFRRILIWDRTEFNITETVGRAINLGSETRQTITTGAVEGAVNVFFTKGSVGFSSEATNYDRGQIFINTVRGADPSDLTHGLIHALGISGANKADGYWPTPRNILGGSAAAFVPGYAEYRVLSIEELFKRKADNYYGDYYFAKTGLEPSPTASDRKALNVIRQGAQKYLKK